MEAKRLNEITLRDTPEGKAAESTEVPHKDDRAHQEAGRKPEVKACIMKDDGSNVHEEVTHVKCCRKYLDKRQIFEIKTTKVSRNC